MEPNQTENNQNQIAQQGKGIGAFIGDLIIVVLISMAIILPVRYYVAQPFIVSGSSMEPNFHTGEYLIIDELTYRTSQPQRGDIIVFKFPRDTRQYFIKRVIGLPGETVQIINGGVKIFNKNNPNGFMLREPYLPANNVTFGSDSKVTLGSDEFFALGDNRMASSDSRFWGPVPRNDIVGKAVIRAFPFQNFSKFSQVQYTNQ